MQTNVRFQTVTQTRYDRTTGARPPSAAKAPARLPSAGPMLNRERDVRSQDTGDLLFKQQSQAYGAPTSEISFGPFRLRPAQFLLLDGDEPVSIGSRALQILIVLLERRGELVSNPELMARVWPNIFVEPANLTVHMSALRRVLGDGRNGNRFIINIPGRGYRFVASVRVSGHDN